MGVTMRKIVLTRALSVTGFLTSAALAADRMALTPSGQPEMVFPNTSLSDASGKLVGACMDSGFQVTNQAPNQVTCEVPLTSMKSALTQMLIGNSYSTTPRSYVSVSLAQIGSNVRTQARAWVETQMAFGQVRQQPYIDDKTFNNLLSFLGRAGGALPHGTRFTQTYVGFDASPETSNASAMDVVKVFPTSPGEKAGLLVGDRVTTVNGKGWKDFEDYQKRLRAVKPGTIYSLGVQRAGKQLTLNVVQAVRPTVGSAEWNALTTTVVIQATPDKPLTQ